MWVLALLVVVLCVVAFLLVWAQERGQSAGEPAERLADGTQEARVVVDRGYRPSRIELEAGVPATLRFERRGDDPCTELLVSELWPNAHRLVARGETAVRFTPERAGRYRFTCGMGMYTGELLVHEGRAT